MIFRLSIVDILFLDHGSVALVQAFCPGGTDYKISQKFSLPMFYVQYGEIYLFAI